MKSLRDEVESEALRVIRRHERYAQDLHDEWARRNRRSGRLDVPVVLRPSYWKISDGFNPYKVRSRVDRIAHSVRHGLRSRRYVPRPPVEYQVSKEDNSVRTVSVFQIPDSTVSRLAFTNLLVKNRPRLSAYSFAYRHDLTVHDAIRHVAAEISGKPRIFVAEYDFRKYFDSIYHEHIWRILRNEGFLFTDVERQVMQGFLQTGALPLASYDESQPPVRDRGVPQGTSISLFLANVAAWPLDRALERLGVGFARYADDTLIWSHSYSAVCDAAEVLNEVSQDIGAELNLRKSEGISILTSEDAPAEFRPKKTVDFVGYSFSANRISIRQSSVRRMKERLSFLIYTNLLKEPKAGTIVPARFAPPIDRDYVVLMYQIRRYLYGNLSEEKLRRYTRRTIPRMHYRGKMAFYPLVDDVDALRGLDGWLLHTVYTALRKRGDILRQAGHANLPKPHGLSKRELISYVGRSSNGTELDMRLPSFRRMAKLLRKASDLHGPNAIGHLSSNQYYLGY